MMIMHEPDKKTPENGFLSLFCIFQSQQTGGGGQGGKAGEKKKRSIFTVGLEQAGCLFLKDSTLYNPRYAAGSGLTFPVSEHRCGKGQCCSCPMLFPKQPLS